MATIKQTQNTNMKYALIAGASLLVLWLITTVVISNEMTKIEDTAQSYVGSKFILDGDTATIIDYSLLRMTYTLSDGREVSSVLVEKP